MKNKLRELAVWMTGCGYDFTQHDYFLKNRYLLSTPTNEGAKTADNYLKEQLGVIEAEKKKKSNNDYLRGYRHGLLNMHEHATKAELPTDEEIIKESEKWAGHYYEQGSQRTSSIMETTEWDNRRHNFERGTLWMRSKFPQSNGQRYGETDMKKIIAKVAMDVHSKGFGGCSVSSHYAGEWIKDNKDFIQSLQSKEQEPKGSEERSDKLEAFLDYCNVNKARIIEDYYKSLSTQEPKGSDEKKVDITKQVYGPASSKNYFGDERDGNLTN